MGRHNQTAINRRVADIYGLVVDGLPVAQISRYVAANCSWHAADRSLCRHIARARALMLEDAKVTRKETFAESLARKQRLFARASVAGQLKTALAVQNSIDRMFGDFAGTREEEMSELERFRDAREGDRLDGKSELARLAGVGKASALWPCAAVSGSGQVWRTCGRCAVADRKGSIRPGQPFRPRAFAPMPSLSC